MANYIRMKHNIIIIYFTRKSADFFSKCVILYVMNIFIFSRITGSQL